MIYQMIHDFEGFLNDPQLDGATSQLGQYRKYVDPDNIDKLLAERLEYLKSGGIDGLVVNVGGSKYLEDNKGWLLFLKGLSAAVEQGFKIWIYDEDGYPSGSAGGFVLKDNPEMEAMGIKYNGETCYIEILYEGTHASNNYYMKRRYINLLDSKAVKKFASITHMQYKDKIPVELFKHVEAFFTDEPSMMSVVTGEVHDEYVKDIPILDKLDEKIKILPSIPFSIELEFEFSKCSGMKLIDAAPKIFEYSDEPSALKCVFWETVSIVYERTFALQLSEECSRIGKKLTGHILCEETPFDNMIFHSNPFRVLKHFHLPGVDLLTNKIENISVFAHKLPFSCAFLTGKGGTISETSDFVEYLLGQTDGGKPNEKKPANKEKMAAALSMQFLLGVRKFSNYYDFRIRSAADYLWVNSIIKRMCCYAGEFAYKPSVALYCPYENFWSGYTPTSVALCDVLKVQPQYLKDTQTDILRLCNKLFENNIQFILFDNSSIQELIECGIKEVIIPECKVISKGILDAAESDRIHLYGHKPELFYENGGLGKVGNLKVDDENSIILPNIPFWYDKGVLFASYKRNQFFCFNPLKEIVYVKLHNPAIIYDPFEDSKYNVAELDKELFILPGRSMFLNFEGLQDF